MAPGCKGTCPQAERHQDATGEVNAPEYEWNACACRTAPEDATGGVHTLRNGTRMQRNVCSGRMTPEDAKGGMNALRNSTRMHGKKCMCSDRMASKACVVGAFCARNKAACCIASQAHAVASNVCTPTMLRKAACCVALHVCVALLQTMVAYPSSSE
eukprot:1139547-Pelagomonas_calceolata.AAC.17